MGELITTNLSFEEFIKAFCPDQQNTAKVIHDYMTKRGFGFVLQAVMDGNEVLERIIRYSVNNCQIIQKGDALDFKLNYDLRNLIRLYRNSSDEMLKEMIYNGVTECSYCINDKCTTFLMGKNRTLELNGKTKKLCGPYRHDIRISINHENISQCISVVSELLSGKTTPTDRKFFMPFNQITYKNIAKSEFYIVGYKERHNALSKSDEELVQSVLRKENGKRKIDAVLECADMTDTGIYAGAIDKFINGNDYEFIFGVISEGKPASLPEGTVCRKIRSGDWAVYNSSTGDYKSIWYDFTENYYDKEQKGYDRSRIPFELYDKDGHLYDVHIPVDEDMPKDSDRSVNMVFMPTCRAAGFYNPEETDHPLYIDYDFDTEEKIKELFPNADRYFGIAIHSHFGKPIMHGLFYAYDDLTDIPDEVKTHNLRAGWFLVESCCHFNGGKSDYPFVGSTMNARVPLNDMHHPGFWLDWRYPHARGGYHELGNPAMITGDVTYEKVQMGPLHLVGRLEAPPESVVTDEEKVKFYSMPENNDPGSLYIAYTQIVVEKTGCFFDKPLIKGITVDESTKIPEGMQKYTVPGGEYVKITPQYNCGEPGWEIEWLPDTDYLGKETGCEADYSRQFIVKQVRNGKNFELYVPVKQ